MLTLKASPVSTTLWCFCFFDNFFGQKGLRTTLVCMKRECIQSSIRRQYQVLILLQLLSNSSPLLLPLIHDVVAMLACEYLHKLRQEKDQKVSCYPQTKFNSAFGTECPLVLDPQAGYARSSCTQGTRGSQALVESLPKACFVKHPVTQALPGFPLMMGCGQ